MARLRPIGVSLLAMILFMSAQANGHELNISRVSIDWDKSGKLALHARLPATMSELAPVAPERCAPLESSARVGLYGEVEASWSFDCGSGPLERTDAIVLPWSLEGVFVSKEESGTEGRFIDRANERIELPLGDMASDAQSPGASFPRYLVFGTDHILSGWDHLAFVLVLCLIASGWRLIKLVTAFTIGHSMTLGLASLGLLNVAAPPLEALIALSIAFMAREAILLRNRSQGYGIVLAFGLLHGLGFAGALNEFGLPPEALLKALFAFNIGVELGQLVFVAVAIGGLAIARTAIRPVAIRYTLAHAIGALAIFWTVERVAGFVV